MKNLKWLWLAVIGWMLFQTRTVGAVVLNEEGKETPVKVEIVEAPIRLSQVTPPVFGKYPQSATKQRIQALGDLEILITDQRQSKATPWKLQYGISTFVNGAAYDLEMKIGLGTASGPSGESLVETPQAITIHSGETKEILEAYSTNEESFTYRVPKEAISIEIPANLPIGKFVGQQQVTLINSPVIN